MSHLRLLGLVVLAAFLVAVPAHAGIIWTEVGDAGALPASAQSGGSGPLDTIVGTLAGGSFNDVDLYLIYINDPAAFSARTLGPVLGDANTIYFDTQLFLFNYAGQGVEGNDDIVQFTQRNSYLTPGNASAPTAPGLYYLAVSAWNNDPTSGLSAMFPDLGDGILAPSGTGVLTGWTNGGESWYDTGLNYEIALTGASAVPEPGTLLLVGSGVIALALRRRKA
jgi:hypothetical protein